MQTDIIGAGNNWLSEEDYKSVREKVPILCVDVLLSPMGDPQLVGLIHRKTYNDGNGWCLVGGRVLRNEHLTNAVDRHVLTTLGNGIKLDHSTLVFRTVIEYFPELLDGEFHDPRKHAVALTYTAFCEGHAEAIGEASDFHWFEISELPQVNFGFGQGEVVSRLIEITGRKYSQPPERSVLQPDLA